MDFNAVALETFRYQYQNNPVYREYCEHLGTGPAQVKGLKDIPFLPIEFFKTRSVLCVPSSNPTVFTSSGTTGSSPSRHFVADISIYEASFLRGFEHFYGPVDSYCFLALLPSYLEREGSSLIYMADHLIRKSGHPDSGFYLNDLEALKKKLETLEARQTPVLLIGV